jgi:hypothetical protein
LIKVLEKGHKGVKLTTGELQKVYTWIDINAPYYPTYDSAYPNNLSGRCPLSFEDLDRLSRLTNIPFRRLNNHIKNRGPMISFDRPILSPCLSKLVKGSSDYNAALAIIIKGKNNLKKKPRADMSGFVPDKYALMKQSFYNFRDEVEKKTIEKIDAGEKVYDSDFMRK